MSVLQTENLTYLYSAGTTFEKTALHQVNVSFEKGDFVGLIGHTGSGKSTLVQHINGLLRPSSGRVLIDGEDIWGEKSDRRALRFKAGLVFQYPEYQLFEETVYLDVAFGPKNKGLSEAEVDKNVREALRFVGLSEDLLDKSPFDLSGGQKRRVAIAGVIAMDPEILILDEPTAGLDPKGRDEILGRVREYHQQRKNTVVLVSHSMEDVASYASHVLVMQKGHAAMYGRTGEVFSHAKELAEMDLAVPRVTQIFLGLKERGCDVRTDIYTVEDAVDELKKITGKGDAAHA